MRRSLLVMLLACHGAAEPLVVAHDPPDAAPGPSAPADVQEAGAAPVTSDAAAEAEVDAGVWDSPRPGFVAKLHADVCFGSCPVYTVIVHANGTFIVAVESPRKGCVTGTAPLAKVGKIATLVRLADFPKIPRTLDSGQNDRRWLTTTITDFGKTYSVRRWGFVQSNASYASIVTIENAILEATDAANLADTAALAACPKSLE